MKTTIKPETATYPNMVLRSSAGKICQQVLAVCETTTGRFIGCLADVDRSFPVGEQVRGIYRAKRCKSFKTRDAALSNLKSNYDC